MLTAGESQDATSPDRGRARAEPDPRRRGGHARGPRAADRAGALDRRPARRGAARAPAGLRGRRQRVDRRAPADRAGLQPRAPASCWWPTSARRTRGSRSPISRARRWPSARYDTDVARDPELVLDWVHERFERAAAPTPGARARTCAASASACPAPVAFSRGEPVAPPMMPGWDGFSIPGWFARHYDAPVLVDNDVNIMALGEHWTHWRDVRAPAVRQGRHRHRLRDRLRPPHPPRRAGRGRRHRARPARRARRRRLPLRQHRLPGGGRGRPRARRAADRGGLRGRRPRATSCGSCAPGEPLAIAGRARRRPLPRRGARRVHQLLQPGRDRDRRRHLRGPPAAARGRARGGVRALAADGHARPAHGLQRSSATGPA